MLSVEIKLTAKDYFALHSDIPNVLKKYTYFFIFSVFYFIYIYRSPIIVSDMKCHSPDKTCQSFDNTCYSFHFRLS